MASFTARSVSVTAKPSPLVGIPVRPPSVFRAVHKGHCASSLLKGQSSQLGDRLVVHAKGKGGKGAVKEAAESKPAKSSKGGKEDVGDVDVAKIEKEAKTDSEDRMKKALTVLGDNFNTIRTGRANPAILDRIMVDYFGSPTPIKNVAAISVPDSSTLLLTPFDRTALKEIEKAINESDLGINPNNDGEKIRLNLPMLTQDRRKELVKGVGKMGEESKVAIRNVRKDVMKKIDKYGDAFSKDAKKTLENDIQKLTDLYCKKTDDMVKAKSDELMKI